MFHKFILFSLSSKVLANDKISTYCSHRNGKWCSLFSHLGVSNYFGNIICVQLYSIICHYCNVYNKWEELSCVMYLL